jgi:hypothetical protein
MRGSVDHDLFDGRVFYERLNRAESEQIIEQCLTELRKLGLIEAKFGALTGELGHHLGQALGDDLNLLGVVAAPLIGFVGCFQELGTQHLAHLDEPTGEGSARFRGSGALRRGRGSRTLRSGGRSGFFLSLSEGIGIGAALRLFFGSLFIQSTL